VKKTVYLSLGSNLGDRQANLRAAIQNLEELGRVTATSSFYETEPVAVKDQPWFLNCAVKLETELMPKQLMKAVLALEERMGRRRKQSKGPRTIDVDILLFGNSLIESKELVVPHPRMHDRRFVLEPMVEIAGDVRHPGLKKTMQELRDGLADGAVVRRVK
jgi:2-amino-4-hydroxy-6-hydroxymethyldihydropteridine diphosphokinase